MTDYKITAAMPTVEALHLGNPVTIRREHNPSAIIRAEGVSAAKAAALNRI